MPAIEGSEGSEGAEAHAAFEGRLRAWLRDALGIVEYRRLARLDDETALVSKFEAGFAPALHSILDRLPQLLDEDTVARAYAAASSAAGAGELRVDAWDRAMRRLLVAACELEGIDEDNQQAFVRVGVDSVRAVLDSVLWTAPTVDDEHYTPARGEQSAYLDATRHLAGRDLWTRTYGEFEERLVQNHCPGAAYARVMLEQGWRVCTGTPVPVPTEG